MRAVALVVAPAERNSLARACHPQQTTVQLAATCVNNQHAKVAETAVNLFDPNQHILFPILRQRPALLGPVRRLPSRLLLVAGLTRATSVLCAQVVEALGVARTSHWSSVVQRRAASVMALINARVRHG